VGYISGAGLKEPKGITGVSRAQELNVFVDYDWTLFDSTRFIDDLWREIADYSGLPEAKVAEDGDRFHPDSVLGGYDLDLHLGSYGLPSGRIWQWISQAVHENSYLYEDSQPFIQGLFEEGLNPTILSFGERCLQTTKIVPNLGRLAGGYALGFKVVFEKKREYFAREFSGKKGLLVDDAPGQNLPNGFIEIHLENGLYDDDKVLEEGVFTVHSLPQALAVIKHINQNL
jgi:hypothetical protein